MILNIISFSCPLILVSIGALFSEYSGTLALFLEGTISLSAFFSFAFTVLTKSPVLGCIFATLTTTLITFLFAFITEKSKANKFIASLGMNIIFTALVTLLSSLIFGTRGVLASPLFSFKVLHVQIFAVVISFALILTSVLFLIFTQQGIYFRITGSNPDLLEVKGINVPLYRILSWCIAAFLSSWGGIILAMRVSSYVPGISGGKGWMALAAVFLGKKKWWQIIVYVFIFCIIDFLSAGIQNFINLPSSVVISLPYLVILMLISLNKFI